jgi:hypothetical protein
VERTTVNPWNWSVAMGYNQGEIVSGHTRTLVRLTVYTTDVDLLFRLGFAVAAHRGLPGAVRHYAVLASRLGAAGVVPSPRRSG